MAIIVGVPRETAAGETRVALVPAVAGKYVALGAHLVVERGAGGVGWLAEVLLRSTSPEIGVPLTK